MVNPGGLHGPETVSIFVQLIDDGMEEIIDVSGNTMTRRSHDMSDPQGQVNDHRNQNIAGIVNQQQCTDFVLENAVGDLTAGSTNSLVDSTVLKLHKEQKTDHTLTHCFQLANLNKGGFYRDIDIANLSVCPSDRPSVSPSVCPLPIFTDVCVCVSLYTYYTCFYNFSQWRN